jgi:hypothetical protein
MKFVSAERLEIARLLDGEPLKRILPTLHGHESDKEILSLLVKRQERMSLQERRR